MATAEELKADYEKRLEAVENPEDVRTVGLHWVWYLKERWALDKRTDIFDPLQWEPKANGLKNIVAYSEARIGDRELLDLMRSETADLYIANLLGAGVLARDLREDAAYLELTKETAIEGVKACRPIYGEGLKSRDCVCADQAATIWLRFVDQLHAMMRLPPVRDLRSVMMSMSDRETELLDSDDFAAYELTDKERDDIKRDIGLSVAAVPRSLRR